MQSYVENNQKHTPTKACEKCLLHHQMITFKRAQKLTFKTSKNVPQCCLFREHFRKKNLLHGDCDQKTH